jgi:predicted Zn-dependent peptidase
MLPIRKMIGDGVALNIIPTDKFKTNCISVRFLCPMAEETAALNALLPSVLKRGCERLPTMADIVRELQMLYGSELQSGVGRFGDMQYLSFTSFPLRDSYTEGMNVTSEILSLMSELINKPLLIDGVLKSEYVESEKRTLTDRVKAQINNKTSYAIRRCVEEMGKGDSSSIPDTGRIEEIAAVTPEALTKRLYEIIDTARIEIWCAGVFDEEKLENDCVRLFARENRTPCAKVEVKPIAPITEATRVTEDQPVKQGKLSLGFTTSLRPTPEVSTSFNLFMGILSSSPTAKLFMNVREKLSLCYYCYAIPDRQKGTVIISSGIEVGNKDVAEKAILGEIDAIKNGEISEEELTSARKSLISSWQSIYDDELAMINWYSSQTVWDKFISPEDCVENCKGLTVADISEVAATLKLHTVYFLNGTLKGESEDDDYE